MDLRAYVEIFNLARGVCGEHSPVSIIFWHPSIKIVNK